MQYRDIPRVEGAADVHGWPTTEQLEEVESLTGAALHFEIPGFQLDSKLSTLGRLALLERVEEVSTKHLQKLHENKRAIFAFTSAGPIHPFDQPIASDPLVPREYTEGKLTPHTDGPGFIGLAVHHQFAFPLSSPEQERDVYLAMAIPGHEVGWDSKIKELPPASYAWERIESIKREMQYRGSGMEDEAIRQHIQGPVFRGTTKPGVLTVFMDGNMAPEGQDRLPQTAHFFEDRNGNRPMGWTRYTMRADDYAKSPEEIAVLREQFSHLYLVGNTGAQYMELLEVLKTNDKDPYRAARQSMIHTQETPDMTTALGEFEQQHGLETALKMARYLLGPGHELTYGLARGVQTKGKAPVYLLQPGDLQ